MTDPAQTALFIVIIILTVLLVALGIQVFFILRALRITLDKANKVLDHAGHITESISRPISSFSTLAMGLKTGATIAKIFSSKSDKKNE